MTNDDHVGDAKMRQRKWRVQLAAQAFFALAVLGCSQRYEPTQSEVTSSADEPTARVTVEANQITLSVPGMI